jgi:hypothetical protein
MGRGPGVHKALDQIGAFAGTLLVAAIVAAASGRLSPALIALAVLGAASILLLILLRAYQRTSDHPTAPAAALSASTVATAREPMPSRFWWFATAAGLCTAGLVTYGLIGFHLTSARAGPARLYRC